MHGGDPTYDFGVRPPATLGANYSVTGADVTMNPGLSEHVTVILVWSSCSSFCIPAVQVLVIPIIIFMFHFCILYTFE